MIGRAYSHLEIYLINLYFPMFTSAVIGSFLHNILTTYSAVHHLQWHEIPTRCVRDGENHARLRTWFNWHSHLFVGTNTIFFICKSGKIKWDRKFLFCFVRFFDTNIIYLSYTPRTLRTYCSQSESTILKIHESSARALFLYNCTANSFRTCERRRMMHSCARRIDSFTFRAILFLGNIKKPF